MVWIAGSDPVPTNVLMQGVHRRESEESAGKIMSKNDILFVFPPAPGNIGAFECHLGVAYVRAALAREGMATAQYLSRCPGTIDAVAADIIGQKCPIVGFTVYDANARLCIALAQSIKLQKPSVRVVFGGPTATFSAQLLMERHPAIDA